MRRADRIRGYNCRSPGERGKKERRRRSGDVHLDHSNCHTSFLSFSCGHLSILPVCACGEKGED